MMRALVLFAASAALAAPASAQTAAAPAPTATQEVRADALALAKLVEPGDNSAAAVASAKDGFLQAVTSDPDSAALEKEYPGIHAALWEAMEPLMRESVDHDTPKLWDRLARLYTARLTPQEIAGLHRFYSTATGQKMIGAMNEKADLAPIIEAAVKSPDATISAQALQNAQAPGRAAAAAEITAEDEAALKALAASVPLPKLHQIGAEVQRETLAWMNEPDPELDARIEKVVEARMTSFMAEADAKK